MTADDSEALKTEDAITDPLEGVTSENIDERVRLWHEDRDRRVKAIRNDGYGVGRSMKAWGEIRTDDDWRKTWQQAEDEYESGRFLLDQLGAEHFLDAPMMAVLWSLRQRLLDEYDAHGPTACMMVDMVIVSFYNSLRVQRWIGDSATSTEYELFGRESPSVKLKQDGYTVAGLRVEDLIAGLVDRLYPLLDRSNRMMLRNLKALKELRAPAAPAAPAVSIQQASQVNVGTQQVNAMTSRAPDAAVPAEVLARGKGKKRKRS